MGDLTKFSKDDLKKTYNEIHEYLKKADEKDFDPNATTEKAPHDEEKLDGTSKKLPIPTGETKTEKSLETKKDFPPEDNTPEMNGAPKEEGMTETSQTDVMQQILAILQEIRGKLVAPAPIAPAPTDQVKLSADAPAPTITPATNPSKSDININVTKSQIEEILKGMGLTPSAITKKPKEDSGHPIEKSEEVSLDKIGKMRWNEIHQLNDELNNKTRERY